MIKSKNLTISIIIAISMLILTAVVCGVVFSNKAKAFSGSGTEASPYLISSASDLTTLAANVKSGTTYSGNYFKLTNNITISDSSWTGIGDNSSSNNAFAGTFDGANYKVTISSLTVNLEYFGFFTASTDTTVIKNLKVHYNSLTNTYGYGYTGGIVGYAYVRDTIFENCHTSGTINSSSEWIGGITCGASGTITNCSNSATISSTNAKYAGGITGYLNGDVSKSFNTGNISIVYPTDETGSVWVGGIAGMMTGASITECYNTGTIKSSTGYYGSMAGGICAHMSSTNTMQNCYNTGRVEAYLYTPKAGNTIYGAKAAGIVSTTSEGSNFYNCIDRGSQYSYADGSNAEWPARASMTGGLCAFAYGDVYNSISVGTQSYGGSGYLGSGGVTLTYGSVYNVYQTGNSTGDGTQKASLATDIKVLSTYSSGYSWSSSYRWDFTNTWGINASIDSGYPVLRTFYANAGYAVTYQFTSTDTSKNVSDALDVFSGITLRGNAVFTREGYAYERWTDGTNYYSCGSAQSFAGSKTLWPDWYMTTFTVSVATNNANFGTVSGGGSGYPTDGTGQTTITATPKTGYMFVEWQKNGSKFSTNASTTFAVTESATYTAIFKIIQYTINVSSNDANMGTVVFEGSVFDYGTTDKQAIAVPKANYAFSYWLITQNSSTSTEKTNPLTVKIDGNKTIQAVFVSTKVEGVNISATYGGSATMVGDNFDSLADADTITLAAKLEVKGYKFVNWIDMNGNVLGTAESIFLTKAQMIDNIITAVFVKINNQINDETDNGSSELGGSV